MVHPFQSHFDTFDSELFQTQLEPDTYLQHLDNLQSNPESYLHAESSFGELDLPSDVVDAVESTLNIKKPFPIQVDALSKISSSNGHYIGSAPSGSGKSLALIISVLSLIDRTNDNLQAIICAPSREIMTQLSDILTQISDKCDPPFTVKVAKQSQNPTSTENLSAQIIIGHPIPLSNMIDADTCLDSLSVMAVDDAEHLLHTFESPDTSSTLPCPLQQLRNRLPESLRIFLFSIVYSAEGRKQSSILAPKPKVSLCDDKSVLPPQLFTCAVHAKNRDHRMDLALSLIDLLVPFGQVLVFSDQSLNSPLYRRLSATLRKDQIRVGSLTAADQSHYRSRVFRGIHTGAYDVILATDIAACGLDFTNVCAVIHMDLPFLPSVEGEEPQVDFHRWVFKSGRCSRAGRVGMVINMTHDMESAKANMMISKSIGRPCPFVTTDEVAALIGSYED
ncbi:hypothetical protein GEMRC1_002723 [Eukaryota sp. GEM-RC1]